MLYNIAVMKDNKKIQLIENELKEIKEKLSKLGTMHPGGITKQYQKCYNPTCKCMREKNPQKHGPYHKLSYVYHGKPVCRFVRAACTEEMKSRVENYKQFRALIDRWVELSIDHGMTDIFDKSPEA